MLLPEISVIMSVYNEPLTWIRESMDSILNQTFSAFEFIIVNDNPNRNELYDFLERYRINDSRIIIINNETNIGLTRSLNRGLTVARGKYIARMDADDISYPYRLQMQLEYMIEHQDIGVCGGYIEFFGEKNGEGKYPLRHETVFLFVENCFAHPTVFIRSEIIKRYMYDESYKVSQDLALWVRLYADGIKFGNISTPLLKYRFSKSQLTSLYNQKQQELSRKLRRDAFNLFCEQNGYDLVMEDKQLSSQFITNVCLKINLPQEIKSKFIYYLLLSNKEFNITLFIKYYIKHLSVTQIFKLVVHKLLRHDIKYY